MAIGNLSLPHASLDLAFHFCTFSPLCLRGRMGCPHPGTLPSQSLECSYFHSMPAEATSAERGLPRICPCVPRKVTRFLCPHFSENPIPGTQLQQCFPENLYTHVLASSVICYVPSSCHNRKCSLTAYSVPHTVLSPFHEVSHSILTTSQEGSHYYPSHVTDRPTETP